MTIWPILTHIMFTLSGNNLFDDEMRVWLKPFGYSDTINEVANEIQPIINIGLCHHCDLVVSPNAFIKTI